jgi:hypothetical protein
MDEARDYHIALHDDPAALDAAGWNGLLARQPSPTVFMRHEYLLALHASGSAVPHTGWAPRFIALEQGRTLRAAAALYAKAHSYGEYVFDWSWAEAYRRHGLRYYPKLLGAVPFTPVAGTRLLAENELWRDRLVQAIADVARDRHEYSSAHLLFLDDTDAAAFVRAGWMLRHGAQFHWHDEAPPECFEAYLETLQRDKRKKIRQERRRVAEAGVAFTAHRGREIDAVLWSFFYRCYTLTYQAHGSTPYLKRAFFEQVRAALPEHWLLFVARRAGEPIGCSLIALDPARRHAYGRYWGATEAVPCLHFEACYYQPLAWCFEHGYRRFEGGAQGEHKMARGLLPVRTTSAHWLRDERFAAAVADFLGTEGEHVEGYFGELAERSPFKAR